MTKKTIEGILNIEPTSTPAEKTGDLFVDQNQNLIFDDNILELDQEVETQPFLNNTTADVTGLLFSGTSKKSTVELLIQRGTLFEGVTLQAVETNSGWQLLESQSLGDATGVTFSITAGGQVQYTSTDTATDGTLTYIKDNVKDTTIKVASSLNITQQPTTVDANTVISPAITMEVLDQFGELLDDGTQITASIASGTGNLSGTTTKAAVSGIVTFDDLQIDNADTFTLQFTGDGVTTATSSSFDVNNSNAATQLVITQQPSNTDANSVISPNITVEARSVVNTLDTLYNGQVTVAIADGTGNLTGTTTVTASGGVATFTDLIIDNADTFTLTFTSGALTSATSDNFVIGEFGWFPYSSIVADEYTLTSTSVTKSAGVTDWDNITINTANPINQPAYFSVDFNIDQITGNIVCGITSSGVPNSGVDLFNLIDYGFFRSGANLYYIISGAYTQIGTVSINDKVTVEVVNSSDIKWYVNDVERHSLSGQSITLPMYPSVSLNGVGTSISGVNINTAVADSLIVAQQPSAEIEPNTDFTVIINAVDSTLGNALDISATGNVTVSFGTDPSSGSAVLSSATSLTKPLIAGVATFDDLEIDLENVGYTLTFTSDSGLGSVTTNSFEIKAQAWDIYALEPTDFTITDTSITRSVTSNGPWDNNFLYKGDLTGDQEIEFTINATSTTSILIGFQDSGVGTDWTDIDSGIYITSSAPKLRYVHRGTIVSLFSDTNWVNGDVIRLRKVGNDYEFFKNDVSIYGPAPIPSGNITEPFRASVAMYYANDGITNFSVSTVSTTADSLTFSTQPPSEFIPNSNFSVEVSAINSASQLVDTAASGTVTLSLGNNPSGGTLSSATSLTKSFVDGVALFDDIQIDNLGVGYTIVATHSGGLASDTSNTIDILNSVWESYDSNVSATYTTTSTSITKDSGTSSWQNNHRLLGTSFDSTIEDSILVFNVASTGKSHMFGIQSEPLGSTATNLFSKIDHAFYFVSNSQNLGIYESGTNRGTFGTWSLSDEFAIAVEGGNVKYYKNGILLREVAANFNVPTEVYPGASLNTVGSSVINIQYETLDTNFDLVITQQPPASVGVGNIFDTPVQVSLLSSQGILNASDNSTQVTANIGVDGAGSGTLIGGTNPVTVVGGIAEFTDLTLNQLGSGFTLNFSSTGLTTTPDTNSFDVVQVPTSLSFSTQPTNTVAGATMSTFQVSVLDGNGSVITTNTDNITIDASLLFSGLSGTLTKAAVAGVATFDDISLTVARDYEIVATSGSVNGTSNTFSITPDVKQAVRFDIEPRNTPVNTTMANFTVEIVDQYGNRTSDTDTIDISLTTDPIGTTNVTGTTSKAAVAGLATFNDIQLDQESVGFVFTASSGILTSDTSLSFRITGPVTLSTGTYDDAFADLVNKGLKTYTETGIFEPTINDAIKQSDGKLVLVGSFNVYNGQEIPSGILRLNTNGTIDTAFQTNIEAIGNGDGIVSLAGSPIAGNRITIQDHSGQQKLVIGLDTVGSFGGLANTLLIRLNSDGTHDTAFTTNLGYIGTQAITDIVQTPDFGIVVSQPNGTGIGQDPLNSNNPYPIPSLFKLDQLGNVDTTWIDNLISGNPANATSTPYIRKIDSDSTGRILVGTSRILSSYVGRTDLKFFFCINADGSINNTFASNMTSLGQPGLDVYDVVVDRNTDHVIARGLFSSAVGGSFDVFKVSTDNATLDSTYTTNASAALTGESTRNMSLLSDGKLVAYQGTSFTILNTNGTVATSPFPSGKLIDSMGNDYDSSFVKVLQDDSILLNPLQWETDYITSNNLVEKRAYIYSSLGVLDTNFDLTKGSGPRNNDNISINSLSDDTILINNWDNWQETDFKTTTYQTPVKLNASYNIDSTFTGNFYQSSSIFNIASGGAKSTTTLGDSHLLMLGSSINFNGNSNNDYLLKVDYNGIINGPFSTNCQLDGPVRDAEQGADGSIYICGEFTSISGTTVNGFAKLDTDGNLDQIFTSNFLSIGDGSGFVTGLDGARRIIPCSDGKLYVLAGSGGVDSGRLGGSLDISGTGAGYKLYRFNSDGTLDTGFDLSINGDGSSVTSAGAPYLSSFVVLDDNSIIGAFSNSTITVGGVAKNGTFFKFDSLGNYDDTFQTSFGSGINSGAAIVKVEKSKISGNLIVGGNFISWNGDATVRKLTIIDENTLVPNATFKNNLNSRIEFSTLQTSYVYNFVEESDGSIIASLNNPLDEVGTGNFISAFVKLN